MAVERMSKVDVSSSSEPSGLVTRTTIVNAPDVRTFTGTSMRVVPGTSVAAMKSPWGNSNWSLSTCTITLTSPSVLLVSCTGIELFRDVSVMRNWSGSVTDPATAPSAWLTWST